MSEFLSEKSEMSPVSEAAILIRRVAEPRPVGDSVKAAIRRAAQALGFSFSRTKDIWYGDARRIDVSEMDALREQAGIYAAVAAKLRYQDEDFHRAQADALEYYANLLSRMAGPGINGDQK
jgi:hypothetical protein